MMKILHATADFQLQSNPQNFFYKSWTFFTETFVQYSSVTVSE